MRHLPLLALLLAAPAITPPALADDARNVFACVEELAGTGKTRETCVGVITDHCQTDPEFQNSLGAITCMERETLAWDGILNGQYKTLRAGLSPREGELIREAQLGWIKARDGECGFIAEFFSRYSGSASAQWSTACRRDRTAERAILLYDWAMRLEDF